MFPSSTDVKDRGGNTLVTSYALHRSDGNWSLMLVNRDETNAHPVRVVFEDSEAQRRASFAGPVAFVTFGSEQYVWHDRGSDSYADPDGPPAGTRLEAGPQAVFTLPKGSVTVLRGKVSGL